jgi:hypothetical protein
MSRGYLHGRGCVKNGLDAGPDNSRPAGQILSLPLLRLAQSVSKTVRDGR